MSQIKPPDGGEETSTEPQIDREIQGHLGRLLKASYAEVVNQPVPDRFRALLEELKRREGARDESE